MALNVEIDNVTLDILSTRLKNVVSPLNILKWLANFKKDEVKYAVDILSNMTVFTTNEIEEILNDSFHSLFKNVAEKERLIVNPVGKFGKSGSMIVYFFQKTEFYKNNKNKIILVPDLDNFEFDKNMAYHLVLLDDFVGSGKTINDYLIEINASLKHFTKRYFVGIAGMSFGIDKINGSFNQVVIPKSNVFEKAFSSKTSIFGYRSYVEPREVAFKYGKRLTSGKRQKNKTFKYVDALGYENSQALVSFAYGSPNNTLPIIWSNKNRWQPLIPRFSIDKISVAREFRKKISYELSILKEFGGKNLHDTFFTYKIKRGNKFFSSVDRIDFSIYSIIKLSRAGHTPISICHKLGISYGDYETCLKIGKSRGIFERDNKLSLFGLEVYRDAKNCIERRKKSMEFESKDIFAIRNINYLPKTFNGRS